MKLLIPGGAGYIGSHMVKYAKKLGHEVVILDDFSTGNDWAVEDCEILTVNLMDQAELDRLLQNRYFDGVIHFAAKSVVQESVLKPDLYYRNNVSGTLNLINCMLKNDLNNLVFSSTAAIFGNPIMNKITEDHPAKPINPYGRSKYIVENLLEDISNAYGLNVACLRYFNAAGADFSGEIGEAHEPETHLIPNILKSVLSDMDELKVYGNDYETKDGTCIRDYIHVNDLALAHMLALEEIKNNSGFSTYNLGNGSGFSVMEVIRSCERVVGKKINFKVENRRAGDPAVLVADSSKASKILNWNPEFSNLDRIIESAWEWHKFMKNELQLD